MADSLRDQLLKAGLITEEQAREAEQKKQRPKPPRKHKPKARRRPGKAPAQAGGEPSLSQAYAARRKLESKEQARQARQRAEDLRRRQEANRKLKALMAKASLNDKGAEERRNYLYGNKIRHVYVTSAQQEGLNDGALGIVVVAGRAHIVSADHYREIRAIKEDAAAFLASDSNSEEESGPAESA